METVWGKTSLDLDLNGLNARLTNYERIFLDLGTGDGRYVHYLADNFPSHFVIGVDSCRENLREYSREKLSNMLFVIASAQDLPCELNGLILHVTINFPWGSLLESLLRGDPKLMCGLISITRARAAIEIRLNGGALAEAGLDLESGVWKIHANLIEAGWQIKKPTLMNACVLRDFPSTWAKRLVHGRDPRAITLSGHLIR